MSASYCGQQADVAANLPVRTALVTGASAGLGHAFVTMLLSEGVEVWGTARDVSRLQSLASYPQFHPVALDLNAGPDAELAFDQADRQAGGFDLLVNNAGYGVFGPFAEADFSVWAAQLDGMLATTARLTHRAYRGMRARGRGTIVNVSSLATEFPLPYMTGYNMAKAGLSALSESLMVETVGTGLTVIDFRPGDHRTGFNRTMQSQSIDPNQAPQLARVWRTLEQNLQAGPSAEHAASDLRRALQRNRSGIVRSGSFFQATLAPFLVRFAPDSLRRAVMGRYLGIC